MAGVMLRSSPSLVLCALTVTVGCGPAVSSSTSTTDGSGTGGSDTADSSGGGSTTVDPGGEDSSSSGGEEEAARVRVFYSTEAGLVTRTAVGGFIGEPELVEDGSWMLFNSGDETVAEPSDGSQRLVGPWSNESLSLRTVDCPQTDGCSVYHAGGAWLASEIRPESMGSDFYLLQPDGDGESVLLHEAAQGSMRQILDGGYLAVTTPLENPTELLRVPFDGVPESILQLEPGDAVWAVQNFVFRARGEDGPWHETLTVVDATSSSPSPLELPLLPAAAGHRYSSVTAHPQGAGVALLQGNEDVELVWVPYSAGTFGEPVQLSTGAAAGGLSLTLPFAPATFAPDGEWLTFSSRPNEDDPSQTYLVRLSDDSTVDPILLGAGGYTPLFTPDGAFVYFVVVDGSSYSIDRLPLNGESAGQPESVFVGPQPRYFSVSDDGSMLEVSSLDADRLWVVDLAGDTPATTEIEVCGTVDVIGTLSPDGSILSCSWEEDDGRGYRLLGLRSGEEVLLDATSTPRMVSIVPN